MNNNFWRGRRVLITGHSGFLGSNLLKKLCLCGAQVFGIDLVLKRPVSALDGSGVKFKAFQGDVSDARFVKMVIDTCRPSVVFHLAAETIVGEAKNDPLRTFTSNISGTWNVLEASRGKKFISALVSASSDKAYGSSLNLPYTESQALEGRHPYDASKSCADILSRSYYFSYSLPVCVVRCGNIYGPGDFHFSRLIPDACMALIKRDEFVVRSDGKYVRDYIYVDDAVAGYLLLAESMIKNKISGEAFNFGNEDPVSVVKVLKLMQKVRGARFRKIRVLNKASDEIRRQYLCCAKSRRILGFKPAYGLAEGLKMTMDWYEMMADKL